MNWSPYFGAVLILSTSSTLAAGPDANAIRERTEIVLDHPIQIEAAVARDRLDEPLNGDLAVPLYVQDGKLVPGARADGVIQGKKPYCRIEVEGRAMDAAGLFQNTDGARTVIPDDVSVTGLKTGDADDYGTPAREAARTNAVIEKQWNRGAGSFVQLRFPDRTGQYARSLVCFQSGKRPPGYKEIRAIFDGLAKILTPEAAAARAGKDLSKNLSKTQPPAAGPEQKISGQKLKGGFVKSEPAAKIQELSQPAK